MKQMRRQENNLLDESGVPCLNNLMASTTHTDIDKMARFLRVRGWHLNRINELREMEYHKGRDEWQVQISPDGWWSLNKFTDSDLPNDAYKGGFEAVGRFESVAEGGTLAELEKEMVSVGAMEWECPHCGETGGTPRTIGWSEFQGCAEHGGMVDFTEECCSKCAGRS